MTATTTESEIWDALADVIKDTFSCPHADIRPDSVASDIDGWDSISHTYLILAAERRFGVLFPEREVHELADVGDLHRLICALKISAP